jgi:hypothetical protein
MDKDLRLNIIVNGKTTATIEWKRGREKIIFFSRMAGLTLTWLGWNI